MMHQTTRGSSGKGGMHAERQLLDDDAAAAPNDCAIGGQRRLALREEGLARARAHNQELHEQGHIRRHGGFQRDLPLL